MVCSLINQKIPDDESSGALSYIKCSQPLLAYHTISSLIQTILSVLESHQISHVLTRVADYTAGGELRPAPKISAICNYKIIFSFVKHFRKTFTISWTEKFFFS